MNNYVSISELNPGYFFDKSRVLLPQYNTKFNDEFPDPEARKRWQPVINQYYQKWQTNDVMSFQFMSNVAPMKLNIYDCHDRLKSTLQFTQKQQNKYVPGLYIYEANQAMNILSRGRYKVEVDIGDPILETIEMYYIDVAENWPDTVLLEYSCSFYYADAIFATGWAPNFRVEGWFKDPPPSSFDTIYQDQVLNQTMLYSDPYKIRTFIVGPGAGLPAWVPDKLIWILGCDEVYHDGKRLTKAEGAKFTEVEIEGHGYTGYAIDLQESLRRTSRIFPVDPTAGGKKLLVALNVETQGFADTTIGSSSNVIQISTVE